MQVFEQAYRRVVVADRVGVGAAAVVPCVVHDCRRVDGVDDVDVGGDPALLDLVLGQSEVVGELADGGSWSSVVVRRSLPFVSSVLSSCRRHGT